MKPTSILTACLLSLAAVAALPQPGQALPPVPIAADPPKTLATPVHGGIYWRHGKPHWNGYRGYTHRRHGYRYHGGYWFPHSAFSYGVIIVPAPSYEPTFQLTEHHYRWCERRYLSYRRWDNTFKPYYEPRKQCVSPYLRRVR
ncbi:MAG: lectin BA14k [Ahrensia sp.]|nr:lectin BA14k [Ahrensia sp.]